ncbi:DinB family protein [Flagellimonas marinaquae]|uniref:DinB family protein n=1 Tax=Flagellimonas marinaquae TaxID=254955 RepID=UPI00207510DB|nr:DinB family protein [Allomuricauda aquimarina]USD26546.1 DinB family protein [Allomuricauda aquimarina]
MAKLFLTPENQIQRLNIVLNNVVSLQELDTDMLTNVSVPDTWSIIEVLAHLNIAYGPYRNQLDEAISNMTDSNEEQKPFRARPWQKMIIEMLRPKGIRRKWKMKTMKRFEPLLDRKNMGKEKVEDIFREFFELHGHLKHSILKSRNKDISKIKITSGIGPIVKFYLPESFEFLLCHLERHMVQIDEILNQQKVLTQ